MTFYCSEFGTGEKVKIPVSSKLEGIFSYGGTEGGIRAWARTFLP